MPRVVKPHTFVDDTTAYAIEVNENFDVLYDLVNGNLDDANQSNRTISDSTVPPGNTGSLTQLLSWLANRIKAILGTTSWRDAPPVTLQAAKQHIDRTDNPHNTTAAQVGALVSVEGVSNAGGNIDLISGGAITIAGNNTAKTITISETHSSRTDNPHATTAAQVGALVSVDGVSNAGGNVDLIPGGSISITPNNTNKTITISETHSSRTDNPHNTTAAQVGALVSVDGVSNAGGNVDLVAGGAISITPNNTNKTITISESHSARTDNPHSTTAAQVGALVSVDGVSNAGGNIDLVQGGAITITSNNTTKTITISETHSSRTDNPHNTTAAQVGALVSIDGVSNAGGNIDLVPGNNIFITPDNANKTITISANVTIMTGTVAHGGYVPIPSGYTEGECSYIVSPSAQDWGHQGLNYFTHLTMYYRLGWNNEPRRVEARMNINGDHWEYGSVNYLCIAKKG